MEHTGQIGYTTNQLIMTAANPTTASSPSSSASLIVRVQQGDPDAWDRFAAIYSPLVYSWARGKLQPSDAADVTQNVFRSLLKNIGTFKREDRESTFRGWLWTVTRNVIHDHFRHQAKQPDAAGGTAAQLQMHDLPEQLPASQDGSDVETSRLGHRGLEIVRAEIEPSVWQAFWRVTVEGDASADVAEDLGVTKWAVYKAKTRVLRRLRQELGELG